MSRPDPTRRAPRVQYRPTTTCLEVEAFLDPKVVAKAELDALEALLGPDLGLGSVDAASKPFEFS